MKRKVALIIAILVFVFAAAIIVYPLVSNYKAEKQQSAVYSKYTETVANTEETKLEEEKLKANQYNQSIIPGLSLETDTNIKPAEYDSLLNLGGNGIMGYVNISKLDIRLPIYHGSDSRTLEFGCGHLEFTSLPVGGESTHSVITAHSGMTSQKLFSDLDMLQIEDIFYLEVLGEKLYYKVQKIKTVLPYEINDLKIESSKDLCSLITCTPFGVNTHRLIVTGERIELSVHNEVLEKTPEAEKAKASRSTWEKEYIKAVLVGFGIFAVVLISFISLSYIKRKLKR